MDPDIFEIFDIDKDGHITFNEFKKIWNNIGIKKNDADSVHLTTFPTYNVNWANDGLIKDELITFNFSAFCKEVDKPEAISLVIDKPPNGIV